MRLEKGALLVDNREHCDYCIGVLLYRKNKYWYYSITSPHNVSKEIVIGVTKATRWQILRGIELETIKYYPPPRKVRREKI
jgi:hypothetical protein